MQCKCIEELRAKLREHLTPKVKGEIKSIECASVAFVLGESKMDMVLTIPFSVKADAPGYRSAAGKTWPVHASYCPFCGTPAKAEKAAA